MIESYSLIVVRSDRNLELIAIRIETADQTVFTELINLVLNYKLSTDKKRFIFTADGAKYYKTEKMKDTIKINKWMIIQVAYSSSEFSHVELLIKWVKCYIKRSLRAG